MRRLIDPRRLEVDRIFYDEYRECTRRDNKEVHDAYADTVILLKKIKAPANREIDTTGKQGPRGRFEGRRAHYPTEIQRSQTTYGRPEQDVANETTLQRFELPALVDLGNSNRQVQGAGIAIDISPSISIAQIYLDEQNIEINPVEDFFSYKNKTYRITSASPRVNFLNMVAETLYGIEES